MASTATSSPRPSSSGWRSAPSTSSRRASDPGWSTSSTSSFDRGLRLGALSDYPATRKLEALGVADRFDVVLSAQDPRVHAFKPSPKGLLVALEELGAAPGDALYVGDREDVDGAAARAAGMRYVIIGATSTKRRPATGPRAEAM